MKLVVSFILYVLIMLVLTQNISSGTEIIFPQTDEYNRALNIYRKKSICILHNDVLHSTSIGKHKSLTLLNNKIVKIVVVFSLLKKVEENYFTPSLKRINGIVLSPLMTNHFQGHRCCGK